MILIIRMIGLVHHCSGWCRRWQSRHCCTSKWVITYAAARHIIWWCQFSSPSIGNGRQWRCRWNCGFWNDIIPVDDAERIRRWAELSLSICIHCSDDYCMSRCRRRRRGKYHCVSFLFFWLASVVLCWHHCSLQFVTREYHTNNDDGALTMHWPRLTIIFW